MQYRSNCKFCGHHPFTGHGIAAGISVAIVVVVQTLGTDLNATFTTVANALK